MLFFSFLFFFYFQIFSCMLDSLRLLKENKLWICACLSFGDYSLFVNANHYYPDQKLKYSEHIFYRHKYRYFSTLILCRILAPTLFICFLEYKATKIVWKIIWLCTACTRISSNNPSHSDKHPHPLPPRISALLLRR